MEDVQRHVVGRYGIPHLEGRQGNGADLPSQREHDGQIELDLDQERHQPRSGTLLPRRRGMEQTGREKLHLRRRRVEGDDARSGQLRASLQDHELLVRRRRRRQPRIGTERMERRRSDRTRLRRTADCRKRRGAVESRKTPTATRSDRDQRPAFLVRLRSRRPATATRSTARGSPRATRSASSRSTTRRPKP